MAKKLEHITQPDISLYINGEFVQSESGETFENFNPFTNDKINVVQEGRKEDIDKAVAAAREAFDNGPWRTMKLKERMSYIYKIADLIDDEVEKVFSIQDGENKLVYEGE